MLLSRIVGTVNFDLSYVPEARDIVRGAGGTIRRGRGDVYAAQWRTLCQRASFG